MSKDGVMELDAYRLAQYSIQCPCFICGGGNNFDAELCRHCQAPMMISRQAMDPKTPPRMIATIGSADAGKTVYLGMLTDMLSRQGSELELVARGPLTVSLQQATVDALSQGKFPMKTPNEPDRWNWVHSQIKAKHKKQTADLIIPDIAGEAILEEINHPRTFPVIRAFLSKCAGVMVLIDANRLESGDHDQDFFATKTISFLCDLDQHKRTGWANRPVALVFTKADQCDACFADPASYAQKHIPGAWQQCSEKLNQFKFFAAGVAGACGYRQELGGRSDVPLRIEPRGIVEPFRWLVDLLLK